jgi:hypothetical protein
MMGFRRKSSLSRYYIYVEKPIYTWVYIEKSIGENILRLPMNLLQKIAKCDGSSEQLDDIKQSIAELAASCPQQVSVWGLGYSQLTDHISNTTEPPFDLSLTFPVDFLRRFHLLFLNRRSCFMRHWSFAYAGGTWTSLSCWYWRARMWAVYPMLWVFRLLLFIYLVS